jgi:hypothetical protein
MQLRFSKGKIMTQNTLQTVQLEFDRTGVRDVKFFFVPEMKSLALSDAKELVASVLKSCFGSEKTPYTGVNDRHYA